MLDRKEKILSYVFLWQVFCLFVFISTFLVTEDPVLSFGIFTLVGFLSLLVVMRSIPKKEIPQ